MSDMSDFHAQVIEEFRTNGGVVGGPFEATPLLLLHTTGAKSGQPRVNPLTYQADGERLVVFASKAGSTAHPDWYRNLLANPKVAVELGSDSFDAVAHVADGEERERLFARQKQAMPAFAEYERTAGDRQIPVIVLERVG